MLDEVRDDHEEIHDEIKMTRKNMINIVKVFQDKTSRMMKFIAETTKKYEKSINKIEKQKDKVN